ncbi:hypothetical protein BH18ACT12_BH18ACT12_20660 [soil metagenome]
MTPAPAWARGDKPSLVENAQEAMRRDVAAGRQHLRGVGHLPLNPEAARFELTGEQRANRGSRPRTRRWKALDKLDSEVDRLTQRLSGVTLRLAEAEQAVTAAPLADAEALANWLGTGEKGDRPPSTIYERERDRDAARLLVAAVTVELDRALERRLQHIERHRKKMLAELVARPRPQLFVQLVGRSAVAEDAQAGAADSRVQVGGALTVGDRVLEPDAVEPARRAEALHVSETEPVAGTAAG